MRNNVIVNYEKKNEMKGRLKDSVDEDDRKEYEVDVQFKQAVNEEDVSPITNESATRNLNERQTHTMEGDNDENMDIDSQKESSSSGLGSSRSPSVSPSQGKQSRSGLSYSISSGSSPSTVSWRVDHVHQQRLVVMSVQMMTLVKEVEMKCNMRVRIRKKVI